MKLIKKIKLSFLVLISLSLTHTFVSAVSPKIGPFLKPLPNEFWEGAFEPSQYELLNKYGESYLIQNNSSSSNPDLFCSSQDDFYRLPAYSEITLIDNLKVHLMGKYTSSAQKKPKFGHWSQYVDNDVTKSLKPSTSDTVKRGPGALTDEWGDLGVYPEWVRDYYHVTDFDSNNATNFNAVQRLGFHPGYLGIKYPKFIGTSSSYEARVACVRDLVPTPSTPVPQKTPV